MGDEEIYNCRLIGPVDVSPRRRVVSLLRRLVLCTRLGAFGATRACGLAIRAHRLATIFSMTACMSSGLFRMRRLWRTRDVKGESPVPRVDAHLLPFLNLAVQQHSGERIV